MEERIIDDEYGRGIRLKKTKDGYVDVTDELAENAETEGVEAEVAAEEEGEEVSFEFPVFDVEEEDEDLIGLDPEEAARIRREREEAAAQRRAEYERLCAEGDELLAQESFHAAELKYEKAVKLDEEATNASVGYWRAKTANFTNPDVLVEEYLEEGIESLEYDLGYTAIDVIKRDYRDSFQRRLDELTAEEGPIAEAFEAKQAKRREYLKARVKTSILAFAVAALPLIVALILTVVFGLKNFTISDDRYIIPTIICGGIALVTFIVFMVFTNKLINACRMRRANERLDTTEEGEKLANIRVYKELYEDLLAEPTDEDEEETENVEEQTEE